MIPTFLFTLAGGMMLALSTGRYDQIAWRFLRLTILIAFALSCGTTLWLFRDRGAPGVPNPWFFILAGVMCVGLVVLILIAPMAAQRSAAFRLLALIAGLVGVALGSWWAIRNAGDSPELSRFLFLIGGQLLAALLLGSVTVAWLLGHAYLTATRMTIAPLRHFSSLLSWSVAARSLFVSLSLLLIYVRRSASPLSGDAVVGLETAWDHVMGAWLILSLRLGVGLVAVAVFAYMVRDCVRLRSTQSATGILYFGSVFAYLGELAGLQLTREIGWPL